MEVKIKSLKVDMPVKNNGVEFEVRANDGSFLGDCFVTKTGIIWCSGKTTKKNGISISWDDFINYMSSE